ncbi:MAG: hypothetical protein D6B28_04810 [Gammaproteobacteria bacterium]|nr:MAG: hypothetical protein D6B28_04810 [Gammaproteobacteria bacterium]
MTSCLRSLTGLLLLCVMLNGCGAGSSDSGTIPNSVGSTDNSNIDDSGNSNDSGESDGSSEVEDSEAENYEEESVENVNQEPAEFAQTPLLATLPDNTAVDLGVYTCEDPQGDMEGRCGGITDYSGFVYDRHRHQMLQFGGGHATTMNNSVMAFDFATLTWNNQYSPNSCEDMSEDNFNSETQTWLSTGYPSARHTYDLMIVTETTKQFLLLRGGGSWGYCADFEMYGNAISHYDIDENQWDVSPIDYPWTGLSAAELDPIDDVVVVVGPHKIHIYDPNSGEVTASFSHNQSGHLSYSKNLVYYPPTDTMYYFVDGGVVFELVIDREDVTNSTLMPLNGINGDIPEMIETGFAYDSSNQIIGGGVRDGVFYAFDPVTQKWVSRTINYDNAGDVHPGTQAFHSIDYDPINNVFIYITGLAEGRHTWAYKYKN